MSATDAHPAGDETSAFSPRTTLIMAAVGVLAAIAFAVLSTVAPEMRGSNDGGAHALSRSAVGYAGLVELLKAQGVPVVVSRSPLPHPSSGHGLLILTPPPGASTADIRRLAYLRQTLLVLPKWRTAPDPLRPGWVRAAGTVPPGAMLGWFPQPGRLQMAQRVEASRPRLDAVFGPFPLNARFPLGEVRALQTASGDLEPMLQDETGRAVLLNPKRGYAYVLTDPDLLNNHGLADLSNARAAMAVIDGLREGGPVSFDVTLNGFERPRSIWRLTLEPPFLAATVCALAAALLMGVHAAVRFGPALRPARSIALGKAALADNAAALIALAGREARLGGRYAALSRRAAARAVGLRPELDPPQTDTALDRLHPDAGGFSAATTAAEGARDTDAVLDAAWRLHRLRMEITRER